MKNKILTSLMAATMVMGSAMPVFAATTASDTVNETQAVNGTTREAEVTYTQSSTFTVTIPKTIALDGSTKASDYDVNVKGDISSDKQVTVTPDASFKMKDQSTAAKKKADVDATVTQASTIWSSEEVNVKSAETTEITGTTKNGNISATGLSSGSWKGTFNFSVAMSDAQ